MTQKHLHGAYLGSFCKKAGSGLLSQGLELVCILTLALHAGTWCDSFPLPRSQLPPLKCMEQLMTVPSTPEKKMRLASTHARN